MHPSLHLCGQQARATSRTVAVRRLGPDCKSCPYALHGKARNPVLPDIPKNPSGVILLDTPSGDDCEKGEYLSGLTGGQLRQEMQDAGVLGKVAVLATTACSPNSRDDMDVAKAGKACRPVLDHYLAKLAGLPTLAAGKWASSAITGKARAVQAARGFVRWGEVDRPLIVTWSPEFALFRSPWNWGEFTVDMQRFGRVVSGKLREEHFDLNIAPRVSDVRQLVASADFLAVDIETAPEHPDRGWTGKDPTRARLKSVAIGTETRALAHWWGRNKKVEAELKRVLENPSILKVWQNGYWFDDRVLKRYDITVTNVMDTRDMRRAISSTSRLGLGYQASVLADFPPWKESEDEK
jgi:uracil-DNA glycosylase